MTDTTDTYLIDTLRERVHQLEERERLYRNRAWAAERQLGDLRAALTYVAAFIQQPAGEATS